MMKKIYALAAGLLLTGAIQTFAQGNFSSNVTTGDWGQAGTWLLTSGSDVDGVPDSDDNVSILDGHTITLTNDAFCSSLIVGGGTSGMLIIGNSAGDDLTVSGNITTNSGATIQAQSTGVLTLSGNLTNNGILDLNNGANDVNTIFNGTGNQTVSGTGSTTDFNLITINNSGALNNNIVEIASTTLTVPGGFLTLTSGIFKLSVVIAGNTIFAAGNYTIPVAAGFWLNSATTVTALTGGATLAGSLRISAGIFNVGTVTSTNGSLEYTGSASQVTVNGGTLTIAGRFCRDGNNASTTTYTQTAGTLTVSRVGSTSTTRALFDLTGGSSFTMSGGSITLQQANALNSLDYFNEAGTYNVTGGSLLVGNNTPSTFTFFRISTTVPVGTLAVGSVGTPTCELLTDITAKTGVTIGSGGILNANNHNIVNLRSWFNNGGTFNAGTGTVTMDGTVTQVIGGLAGSPTTFNNLVINNSSATGVNLTTTSPQVTGTLTLIDGYVNSSAAATLILADNAIVTGASDASFVSGPIRKVGNDVFTFPTGKSASGFYQPISISAPANITDDFTAEYIRASAAAVDTDKILPVRNVSNCDYWTLTKNSAAAASVNVTLSWNANSNCSAGLFVTNPSTLTVAHYNGAAWDEAGTSGSFTGTATAGTVTRNAVSVFSPFALGNTAIGDNPLPVTFGNLRAYEKYNGVQVEWEIYTEENLSHYDVQRSATGSEFSTIASLPARNVPGRFVYELFDATPFPVSDFYRIRAVDVDGRVTYSPVTHVNLQQKSPECTVYPNPARAGQISFRFADLPKGDYFISIRDNFGRLLYSESFNHNGEPVIRTITLPAAIKAGVYNWQIDNGSSRIMNSVFVVQ